LPPPVVEVTPTGDRATSTTLPDIGSRYLGAFDRRGRLNALV
jgi:hypothetical protein